jgi:hypothetical protein
VRAKRIACLIVIFVFILTTQKLFAAEYAVAAPVFMKGTCSVAIWIHSKGERKSIVYPGNYSNNLCHVEIPVKQFEKHFSYCMLAGIGVNGSDNYLAQFGGGTGSDRNIYWFEWRDPKIVFPTFICILTQKHLK